VCAVNLLISIKVDSTPHVSKNLANFNFFAILFVCLSDFNIFHCYNQNDLYICIWNKIYHLTFIALLHYLRKQCQNFIGYVFYNQGWSISVSQ